MSLFDKVSEDIKTAMKAKDKVALETLRNIKKVFLEAKTAPGAGAHRAADLFGKAEITERHWAFPDR